MQAANHLLRCISKLRTINIALPLKLDFFFRMYEINPSVRIPLTNTTAPAMIPARFILLAFPFFPLFSENEVRVLLVLISIC